MEPIMQIDESKDNFYIYVDSDGKMPQLTYKPWTSKSHRYWTQYRNNKPISVKPHPKQTHVWDYSTNSSVKVSSVKQVISEESIMEDSIVSKIQEGKNSEAREMVFQALTQNAESALDSHKIEMSKTIFNQSVVTEDVEKLDEDFDLVDVVDGLIDEGAARKHAANRVRKAMWGKDGWGSAKRSRNKKLKKAAIAVGAAAAVGGAALAIRKKMKNKKAADLAAKKNTAAKKKKSMNEDYECSNMFESIIDSMSYEDMIIFEEAFDSVLLNFDQEEYKTLSEDTKEFYLESLVDGIDREARDSEQLIEAKDIEYTIEDLRKEIKKAGLKFKSKKNSSFITGQILSSDGKTVLNSGSVRIGGNPHPEAEKAKEIVKKFKGNVFKDSWRVVL